MKKTIITIILVLAMACQVSAKHSDEIIGIAALSVLDLYTSEKLFKMPGHVELNPLLPKKPSVVQMATFGLTGFVFLGTIDQMFDDCFLKDVLFDSVVATEKYIVNDHLEQLDGKRKTNHTFIIVISGEF